MGVGHVAGGEDTRRAGLRGCSSARMPLSTARPAPAASSVRGCTPTPTTTKSQSSVAAVGGAHPLDRRVSLEGLDAGAEQQPHAVVGVDVAVDGADLGAEHALERDGAGSMTVTSRPRWRAEAATSAPIQPAPTTTTEPPRSSRSRRASESSTLRR